MGYSGQVYHVLMGLMGRHGLQIETKKTKQKTEKEVDRERIVVVERRLPGNECKNGGGGGF